MENPELLISSLVHWLRLSVGIMGAMTIALLLLSAAFLLILFSQMIPSKRGLKATLVFYHRPYRTLEAVLAHHFGIRTEPKPNYFVPHISCTIDA